MTLCPVALAVGCIKCPAFNICPAKGIVGAWLTARLAPARPMKHVMILACVGILLGLAGLAASWGKGLGPNWYPVALVVLAIPQCWAGGRIYEILSARRENPNVGKA